MKHVGIIPGHHKQARGNVESEYEKMNAMIPLHIKNVSAEIWARILKAVSRKYGCSIHIDFSQGHVEMEFIGDEASKKHITEEVKGMFRRDFESESPYLVPSKSTCSLFQNLYPPPVGC